MTRSIRGEYSVKNLAIKRIFDSFSELENALSTAKRALESCDNPPHNLLERINAYERVLEKQRNLATALCGHATFGDWNEVARHIRIINGLSIMIRDDAREIITAMQIDSLIKQQNSDQKDTSATLLC